MYVSTSRPDRSIVLTVICTSVSSTGASPCASAPIWSSAEVCSVMERASHRHRRGRSPPAGDRPRGVLLLVGQAKNPSEGQPSTVSSVLKLVFGVLLLLLGADEWRHWPKPG